MGLAATSGGGGSSTPSAWTTGTVGALIAAVLAVAGVSTVSDEPDQWCITAVHGQASRVSDAAGLTNLDIWVGESLSGHVASSVVYDPTPVTVNTQGRELYGECSSSSCWVTAESQAGHDTVPSSDGFWNAPACLFVVTDSSASHVEDVWEGWHFGWAHR